jgi:hypothetical protein
MDDDGGDQREARNPEEWTEIMKEPGVPVDLVRMGENLEVSRKRPSGICGRSRNEKDYREGSSLVSEGGNGRTK